MSTCRHLFLLAGLCAMPGHQAFAQTGTPLDEGRIDRDQPIAEPEPETVGQAPTESLSSVEAGDENAVPIQTIRFVGSDVPLVVGQAAQSFIGTIPTRENLQALTSKLSAAYGNSDVALFTIVVPEQDLSTGELRVFIAEGYIQNVVLEGEVDGGPLDLVRAYAAKLTDGKVASRRKLERYLSLIRDIPGLKVKSRLETGNGRGAVRHVLELDYEKPRLLFSYDNRSTQLIKDGQFDAKARFYSLLRDGDLTEITAASSVNFKDLRFFSLSHSTPIGAEGTRLGLSVGHLETSPSDTPLSGNAETFGLTLTRPIIRSYRRNLTATFALDGVNSDNTAFGSIIASEKTRAVRAALGYSQTSRKTAVNAGFTVSHGLDILGASIQNMRGDTGFLKINEQAGITQSIGKVAAIRLKMRGQWTNDPLPAIERFSVGGAEFGRAFERGLISADRGIATNAEIALRPLRSGTFARSEVYTFVDYAYVGMLERAGSPRQDFDLASAGAGIRFAWRDNAMIGFEAARTVDKPYPAYNSEWRLSISWRLNIKS
jgi:hemolysin activation/secretion protein